MDNFSQRSSDRTRKRVQLDPSSFVIATEGMDEINYFRAIEKLIPKRFNAYYDIHVVDKSDEHHSALHHIFSDLDEHLKSIKKHFRNASRSSYIVFDHDKNFRENHIRNSQLVLRQARQKDYTTIYSNPCFDLWLILHYVDVTQRDDIPQLLSNSNNHVKQVLHSVRDGEDLVQMSRRYKTAIENAQKLIALSNCERGNYPTLALVTEVKYLISDIIEAGLLPA
ncbi:RloB-like protein [Rheinheimera pacifica]|uniref:RloB-like protein n=1 Tax=Rheinheimera pacifica TaxID=173990 RepID=A0A1H6MK05_9GAMM|nr:RloB family protein [Rheinheimera pacifica]SEI02050.1 RloB-like protein [Rheinheimera pacifica]